MALGMGLWVWIHPQSRLGVPVGLVQIRLGLFQYATRLCSLVVLHGTVTVLPVDSIEFY
jgi:hypothetical protein